MANRIRYKQGNKFHMNFLDCYYYSDTSEALYVLTPDYGNKLHQQQREPVFSVEFIVCIN